MSITIRPAAESDAAVISEFNSLMAKETENKSLPAERIARRVDATKKPESQHENSGLELRFS